MDAAERDRQPIAIVGPVRDKIRAGAEAIQEELVELVVHQAEEAIDRAHRRRPLLAGHAAAGVDDDAEADRRAIGAEVRDLDRLVVLVDEEVFLAQPAVEAARSIGDGGRHVDQLDAALELEAALFLREQGSGERENERGERDDVLEMAAHDDGFLLLRTLHC